MVPIAAPAASTPAAFLARCVPLIPARSFFCFSCFSINVALAGKMAGNARNNPPTAGPKFLAISPASTVTIPPNTNRTAYSYHFVSPSADRSTVTFMTGLSQPHYPEAKSRRQPYENHGGRRSKRGELIAHEQPARARGVDKKSHRARHHRTGLRRHVRCTFRADGKGQSSQGDGRGSTENSSEAFRLEQIPQDR